MELEFPRIRIRYVGVGWQAVLVCGRRKANRWSMFDVVVKVDGHGEMATFDEVYKSEMTTFNEGYKSRQVG